MDPNSSTSDLSTRIQQEFELFWGKLVVQWYVHVEEGLLADMARLKDGDDDSIRAAIETWTKEGVNTMAIISSYITKERISHRIPTEEDINKQLWLAVEPSREARGPSHHDAVESAGLPHRTHIYNMPPEILEIVLGYLPASPPEMGEQHSVADHRDLHSMCLVSRHLSGMAYPLLYRTVLLWDEAAIYLFFRTLCRKPGYGLWTRQLA